MSDYNTFEWQVRRAMILARDKFKCRSCESEKELHVHHKKYDRSFKLWEYDDYFLVTLCRACHDAVHRKEPIGNFYITDFKLKKWKFPASIVKAFKESGIVIDDGKKKCSECGKTFNSKRDKCKDCYAKDEARLNSMKQYKH